MERSNRVIHTHRSKIPDVPIILILVLTTLLVLHYKGYFVAKNTYSPCETSGKIAHIDLDCLNYSRYKSLYSELLVDMMIQDELLEQKSNAMRIEIHKTYNHDIIYGGVGMQKGSRHTIWIKKTANGWRKIYAGQGVPACSLLERFDPGPGAECFDEVSGTYIRTK
jgi:hypothetical protein